jgi:hypothetical protein
MAEYATKSTTTETKPTAINYEDLSKQFSNEVVDAFKQNESEISQRNADIDERDQLIYSDLLQRSIDIPLGHDSTPVNWLRRTIEIHKNMFMGRGFQITSTYDTQNIDSADPNDTGRLEIENEKQKEYAEARKQTIDAIIEDNGGNALWSMLAESGGAAGDAAVKCYYDEEQQKYVISPIETIENVHVIWARDDFRQIQAIGYVYQITKEDAVKLYDVPEDTPTSPLGEPLTFNGNSTRTNSTSSQKMITVIEATGKFEGWSAEDGKCKRVPIGQEKEFNAVIVGNQLKRVIDQPKKMPRYYILPNKRQRRRPWGLSDITDAAININVTYIETLSDWRTVAAKVNFPKYKAFGFGKDTQLPKSESRKIQVVPLADGQDMVEMQQGDANQIDFKAQMDELKEQYVRETGISRVLFDDPSVTFNSNQALLTSLKPTSDIAEAKKQLWSPILVNLFTDALETLAEYDATYKDLVSKDEKWSLKVNWPSVLQKEDPVFQSMLLNRFNAGLMSVQSYMEAQGDSKEEIDRITDEVTDPVTAAILGKQLPAIAQAIINAGTAELQAWYTASQPTPNQPPEQPGAPQAPGVNPNGGTAVVNPTAGPVQGGAGLQPVSQPGTGATAASPAGAVVQTAQNNGA